VLCAWASQAGLYPGGRVSLRVSPRTDSLEWSDADNLAAPRRYNARMSGYRFFHPMEVRYGDLDPQGHVNNAKYLTYFEQARVGYLTQLGLFSKDQSFSEIGVIIADIHIRFHEPLYWGIGVKVGVRTSRIGGKSLGVEQCIRSADSDRLFADGTVVLVAYDYSQHATIPVPARWREIINDFENELRH
jgi:acyl-CoA thioester hydrolase